MKRGIEHLQNEADKAESIEKEKELSFKRPKLSIEESQSEEKDQSPNELAKILKTEAYQGNIDKIEALIEKHSLTLEKDKNYFKLILHFAAKGGQISTFEHFVQKYELELTCQDDYRKNSLHYAAEEGQIDTIEFLIEKYKLDPKSENKKGNNALYFAAKTGQIDTLKYFFEKLKLNPDNIKNQVNILFPAAKYGQIEVFDHFVINYKFDPSIEMDDDEAGPLVLHIAAQHGQKKAFDHFVTKHKLDPQMEDYDGKTSLHYAAQNGQIDTIDHLVETHKLDPHQRYEENLEIEEDKIGVRTALNLAAYHSQMKTFDHLVKKYGLNPKEMEEEHKDLLFIAIEQNNIKVINHLIKYHNFNPEENMTKGINAFHWAAKIGNSRALVHLITEYDFDPHKKDEKGKTALHHAVYGTRHFNRFINSSTDINVVQTLLKHCAFNLREILPTLDSTKGFAGAHQDLSTMVTYFDLVKANQCQEVESFLESCNLPFLGIKNIFSFLDNGENPLLFPLKVNNLDLVTLLLMEGASLRNINIENEQQANSIQTCLLHAIIRVLKMGNLVNHQNPLVELDEALLQSLSDSCQRVGVYQDIDRQVLAELLMSHHVICQDYVSLKGLQVKDDDAPLDRDFHSNTIKLAIQYFWLNFDYDSKEYAENLTYIQRLGELLGEFSQGMEGLFTSAEHPIQVTFGVIDKLLDQKRLQAQINDQLISQNDDLSRVNKEQAQLIEKLMQENALGLPTKTITTALGNNLHQFGEIDETPEKDEYHGINAPESWMPVFNEKRDQEPCIPTLDKAHEKEQNLKKSL